MEKGAASDTSTEIQCTNAPSPNSEKGSLTIEIPEFDNWSMRDIFTVPRKLRELHPNDYTPRLVSIGPFHHNKEELKGMESHKEEYYLSEFCNRAGKSKEDLLSFIRDKTDNLLSLYAGSISIEREEFEKLILIDSCFIFEIFSRYFENQSSGKDYILDTPWLLNQIRLDMIMLENQIPFPFLERLYDRSDPSFLNLTLHFFEFSPGTFRMDQPIKHFTDLFRQSMLPNMEGKSGDDNSSTSKDIHTYPATTLDKAGVYFAPAPEKEGTKPPLATVRVSERRKFIPCFRSIQLELSTFHIEDRTECIMRNIIALEECCYQYHAFICHYIFLMSDLVETEEDIDFLVEKKIIENSLGSNKAAAKLLNGLCRDMMVVGFSYCNQCKQLNDFYGKWYNVAKATLKKVYFKDLWTASSTVVGIFVLIFSISATIKSLFF